MQPSFMNEADGCTPFHFFPDPLTIDQMLWLGLRTGSVNVSVRLKGLPAVFPVLFASKARWHGAGVND